MKRTMRTPQRSLNDPAKRKRRSRMLCALLCLGMILAPALSETRENQPAPLAQAASDVELVRLYARQLREQNRLEDYAHGGFTWDTERRPTSWRYYNGFMIDAFLRLGGPENAEYAEAFFLDHIQPDGSIPDYIAGYLDSVEPARALFRLLPQSKESGRYRKAIQWVYAQLEKQRMYPACGNNYLHCQDENRRPAGSSRQYPIFLDGMYMTQPFLAACAVAVRKGEISLTDQKGRPVAAEALEQGIVNRYIWLQAYLYGGRKALYQHGWNVQAASGNGHSWGRGIGWLAMSMADIIQLLPEGAGRDRMILLLRQLLDGMLRYQDQDTGMWYNVVDRGPDLQGNRLETSASAMMAYTLVKAWNDGYADGDRYLLSGLKAFHGVIEEKADIRGGEMHLRDTYLKSGVGESDGYYCKEKYTTDEAKGAAALLMAAAEVEIALQAIVEKK